MSHQYYACAFPNSDRTYTFHNDGEPVEIGDKVEVDGRGGGKSTVIVTKIVPKPTFPTKPIIGKAPEKATEE